MVQNKISTDFRKFQCNITALVGKAESLQKNNVILTYLSFKLLIRR